VPTTAKPVRLPVAQFHPPVEHQKPTASKNRWENHQQATRKNTQQEKQMITKKNHLHYF
jgi:hypothetical protein